MKKLVIGAFSSLLLFQVSCKPKVESEVKTDRGTKVAMSQGWLADWDMKHRSDWYNTTQGSHLIDFKIFRSLVVVEGKTPDLKAVIRNGKTISLSSRAFMESVGFIYPANEPQAKHFTQSMTQAEIANGNERLPFGLLKDVPQMTAKDMYINKGQEYLGYTCAACHTGEVKVNGNRFVIDGGQTLLDQGTFFGAMLQSLWAASLNPDVKKIVKDSYVKLGGNAKNFDTDLHGSTNRLAKILLRGSTKPGAFDVSNGPGRSDAVTNILNALTGDMVDLPSDPKTTWAENIHNALGQNKAVLFPPIGVKGTPEVSVFKRLGARILKGSAPVNMDDSDENLRSPNVPVSIPFVWDAPSLECVQTNCLAQSPLIRNIGEVLGVFGYVELNNDVNVFNYRGKKMKTSSGTRPYTIKDMTTAKIDNIIKIENSLYTINSPKWPAAFGDLPLKDKGREIYGRECASCHASKDHDTPETPYLTKPNQWGKRFIRVTEVPFDQVKGASSSSTDSKFIEKHGPRTAKMGSSLKTGLISTRGHFARKASKMNYPYPKKVFDCLGMDGTMKFDYKGKSFNQNCKKDEVSALDTLTFVTSTIAENYLEEKVPGNLKAQQKAHGMHPYGSFVTKPFYRARPLNGIVFTGPYLHNGSVRTLRAMLNPELRTNFKVGSTELDIKDGGFVDATLPGAPFVMDTSKHGNKSTGHYFGTDLSPEDKEALLDYLKSI